MEPVEQIAQYGRRRTHQFRIGKPDANIRLACLKDEVKEQTIDYAQVRSPAGQIQENNDERGQNGRAHVLRHGGPADADAIPNGKFGHPGQLLAPEANAHALH